MKENIEKRRLVLEQLPSELVAVLVVRLESPFSREKSYYLDAAMIIESRKHHPKQPDVINLEDAVSAVDMYFSNEKNEEIPSKSREEDSLYFANRPKIISLLQCYTPTKGNLALKLLNDLRHYLDSQS